MIGLQIIFEDAGTGNGEKCIECKELINGIKFQMILQVGKTEQGNITAFDAFICKKCKVEFLGTEKGAKF